MYYPRIEREARGGDRNLAIEGFGHRIYDAQTVHEYLIEFLLIFCSPKRWGDAGTEAPPLTFPMAKGISESTGRLHYTPTARTGLKRFVFFERSKHEHRFEIDRTAYTQLKKRLGDNVRTHPQEFPANAAVAIIQDLFYGFNAVIRNRAWFTQSLLPVCPELTFCEAMGSQAKRKNLHERHRNMDPTFKEIDGTAGFEYHGHYFLARGGEVYFLHLLRGLVERPDLTAQLENGLKKLVRDAFPQLAWLSSWVEENWFDLMKDQGAEPVVIDKKCEWIPEGYAQRAAFSCEELRNLLDAELPSLQKLDLLAKGIVMHILRMMSDQTKIIIGAGKSLPWFVDVASKPSSNVRKYAVANYRECEEDFAIALDKLASQQSDLYQPGLPLARQSRIEALREGARFGSRLFRKLSKDIGLVVPPKGAGARFTLNEDLVQLLVLCLVRPGQKVLLPTFLEKIKEHFGIVIGPDEMTCFAGLSPAELDSNRASFQDLLKQCGYLKDLSDATAIVENPFGGVRK